MKIAKQILIMISLLFIGVAASMATQAYASWSYPTIVNTDKKAFIVSMSQCVDSIYRQTPSHRHFPKELIIAQAILESGYGTSRFAHEANNLFGIRTWSEDTPHVKPVTHHNEWHGWGVKAYQTKCHSAFDLVRILNDLHFYQKLRDARDRGEDAHILVHYLESFSTNPAYGKLLESII